NAPPPVVFLLYASDLYMTEAAQQQGTRLSAMRRRRSSFFFTPLTVHDRSSAVARHEIVRNAPPPEIFLLNKWSRFALHNSL
ncbi:MAG: hypothetical protein IJC21_04085, partial [Lentisphaeria bacterium]|nr:hypothetical protein [Lentisphaeria bacterium]